MVLSPIFLMPDLQALIAINTECKTLTGSILILQLFHITVIAAIACSPVAPEVEDVVSKERCTGRMGFYRFNLDWPSSRTLYNRAATSRIKKYLDTLSSTGINTVFLQVRPEGDALYHSAIDPWSYWLTGTQGTAPNSIMGSISICY